MTAALVNLTLRALLNRRRTVLLALVGALLVVIAILYRLSDPTDAQAAQVTERLLANLGIGAVVPLVAVIVGTAAIGSELDDGTIVYLLAKPVPRWRIVLVKVLVALAVVWLLTVPAVVATGLFGNGDAELAAGFGAAALVAAIEYTTVFVALSLVTSRALIAGLAYVVVWEGVVAGLFAGTRTLSVRQHALAVAEWLGGDGAAGVAELDLPTALVVAGLVVIVGLAVAVKRLETVELRGETT